MDERAGRPYLVGAGPGAPDLITVRGEQILHTAEVVVYDYLVSPELLALAPPEAEVVYTGKKGGDGGNIAQAELNRTLIEHARTGKREVRLKGGDPFIFGRGGEEAEALRQAGIAFEVVPGVTSALAAGAFTGIPLTHRSHASAVALVTGHEHPGKPGSTLDWPVLARFPGTLAIYMGIS